MFIWHNADKKIDANMMACDRRFSHRLSFCNALDNMPRKKNLCSHLIQINDKTLFRNPPIILGHLVNITIIMYCDMILNRNNPTRSKQKS
jgi:hypothetical protein